MVAGSIAKWTVPRRATLVAQRCFSMLYYCNGGSIAHHWRHCKFEELWADLESRYHESQSTRKLEESFGIIVSRDPYKSSFQLEGARSRQDHLDFRTWPWQIAWLF